MNTIEIQAAHRPAERLPSGGTRTERHYADVVIDGVALGSTIRRTHDLVSRLGWGPPSDRDEAVASLLLEREADFPDNRRALYVCPECGGLDCGAVSVLIERDGDRVKWREFRYESTVDSPTTHETLAHLGPFTFDFANYEAALRASVVLLPPDLPPAKRPFWQRRIL